MTLCSDADPLAEALLQVQGQSLGWFLIQLKSWVFVELGESRARGSCKDSDFDDLRNSITSSSVKNFDRSKWNNWSKSKANIQYLI